MAVWCCCLFVDYIFKLNIPIIMAKYVATEGPSLGAKMISADKAVVATDVNGEKIVEIIEIGNDVIQKAGPILAEAVQALKEFFMSLTFNLPTIIKVNDKHYEYTEQRKPWEGIDKIFYLCIEDPNYRKFEHEGKTLAAARRSLRKELREIGYIN
jgi:hypothetical protein